MALVQHVIVSYAISLAPKLHPFRDFLKETVPWLWSEDINKVFRETKVKLANSREEGVMSWVMMLGTCCYRSTAHAPKSQTAPPTPC